MNLVVATPYPEGSTLAIARAAEATGSLEALFVSGPPTLVGRIPRVQSLSIRGVPANHVRRRVSGFELTRILLAQMPGLEALSSRTMYAGKMAFDRTVAREVPSADAVLGVVASCALTFGRAHEQGSLTVLNFVNSHPRDQNRLLRKFGGLRGRSHEFMADHVVRRVEQELDLADLVLVPSTFVADQLTGRGISPASVSVIPYGVDLDTYHPRTHPRPAGPIRCLFVGQLSHRKGVPSLIRAARRLPTVDFTLAGPVVSRDVIRGLPPNVRRLGALSVEGVSALMRAADIFVLPSIEDSYGLAVIESMACGLPTIVTDHVGASEVIASGENGVVVPTGDDDALVTAIWRLAEDDDLRSRLGRAARARVSAGHSWARYTTAAIAAIAAALRQR